MIENAADWRVLVVPSEALAGYISVVYTFDEVVVAPSPASGAHIGCASAVDR